MKCGVSTACFYPQETAKALELLHQGGISNAEIFLNTFHEMQAPYVEELKRIACPDMRITSLHPFTCGLETLLFASEYEGRFEDGLCLYRRYFEIARQLGASKFVFHGCAKQSQFPVEEYCRRYRRVRKAAREYGIDFCQENVVRCKSGQPEFIRRMREYTEDDISFVLDVKQQRRAEVELDDMLDAMGDRIVHVHLSDYTPQKDCVAPGKGLLKIDALFRRLIRSGFQGDIVIELYRDGFSELEELCSAARLVDRIYAESSTAVGAEKEQSP